MLVDCMIAVVRPANQWHVISDACTCKMCLHTREENKRPYLNLAKIGSCVDNYIYYYVYYMFPQFGLL